MSVKTDSRKEYGLWIVTRVMQKKYITLRENGLSFDGKKHDVTGVRFSPELKNDAEIVSGLKEISRAYLRLYYFLEAMDELRFTGKDTGEKPVTGMTLLSLFEKGVLELRESGPRSWTMAYDRSFTEMVPEPETVLLTLFQGILRFSGEEPADYRLTPETQSGFRTEALSDDLSVTSCFEDEYAFDLTEDESGIITDIYDDGLTVSFDPEEKTERELIVEKNMEDTLKRLSRMISDIDEGAGEVRSDESKYTLSFNDHMTAECSRFTALVPDGFRAETDAEDLYMILWLPNPDNPEEWEASVLVLTAESGENTGDSDTEGEILHRTGNGGNLRFTCLKQATDGAVLFTAVMIGVEQDKQPEAESMIRRLLSGITMR